ncbi:MAG: hypothetical protein NC412_12255 [Roseburia sp.]|nr:hypothetical protein [Roseburia sp.]MCM1279506.1 hypothetical protein [Robinsoniella sp.]
MRRKAYLELFCYGAMSGIMALLFVFGAMYPEYIYTGESYRVITVEGLSEEELQKPVYELDRSKIRISGKIYESILKLLEDRENDKRGISVRSGTSVSEWGDGQDRDHYGRELL